MTFIHVMSVFIGIAGAISTFFFRKGGVYNPTAPSSPELPPNQPVATISPSSEPIDPPGASQTLLWGTPMTVRHSVRVICDQEGLTFEQKNTMCATIGGESEYNTKAIGPNYVVKDGRKILASTDWGLCQWNDYYHGKEISGGYDGEAMNNPEKAVRLMCHYWKMGEVYRVWWIAYKNGRYLHFM